MKKSLVSCIILAALSLAAVVSFPATALADTSYYGYVWPLEQASGYYTEYESGHRAIDICDVSEGTPVIAMKDGVVKYTQEYNENMYPDGDSSSMDSYGNMVSLYHPEDGNMTLYAHLSVVYVSEGEEVEQGQVIGLVGNTGYSVSAHLHFEMREGATSYIGWRGTGTRVDPLNYVASNNLFQGLPYSSGTLYADVTRLWGNYANQTAVAISEEEFETGSCGTAIIARDDDFRDSMSAVGLAGLLHCPILLVHSDGASTSTMRELERLGVNKVFIIGGTSAVPETVEQQLQEANLVTERIAGEYVVDTSMACANKIREIREFMGLSVDDVVITTQRSFMDALSISPLVYSEGLPVVLLEYGSLGLTDEEEAFVQECEGTVYVPGGTAAVPVSSAETLFGSRVLRMAGDDGYETSSAVAQTLISLGKANAHTVCVACGAASLSGVDALCGAALAGSRGGVLVLAQYNLKAASYRNTTCITGFIHNHASDVEDAYILGGTYSLPTYVESLLENCLLVN